MVKKTSKRYFLVLVEGSEPSIVGGAHKTYEKLLKAARKFIDAGLLDGDNLFYLISQDPKFPVIGAFSNKELEGTEEI